MSPPVDRGKRQTASEVAGRQPMLHYWDWEEPRLLVCEAEFVATPDSQKNSTTNATTATTTDTKTNKPVGIQAVRCCRLFLADRTATQYDRLLASSCCPSVCDTVHSDSQCWCTRLKVTPACS